MDRIQTDPVTQFTSKECWEDISVRGVRLSLAAPYHQEMNGQVEVTWKTLRTITRLIMVHARVSEKYIHFALMYITDHIFTVIPIKHLVNPDGEPTIPHKTETSTKPSVSNLLV